jgi:SnoaL-like polyketide cyclase
LTITKDVARQFSDVPMDILAADVVHQAAGGYSKVMNATDITAMMADFLTAFPDLRYSFDQFIVQDDYVVERYTAMGTQQGPFGDLPPSGRILLLATAALAAPIISANARDDRLPGKFGAWPIMPPTM